MDWEAKTRPTACPRLPGVAGWHGAGDNRRMTDPRPGHPVRPPRLWPTLLIALCAIPVNVVVNAAIVVIAALAGGGMELLTDPDRLIEWLGGFLSTPLGFALLFAPGQLIFAAAAIVPAVLSPDPTARRLGLVRGRLPLWSYPVLMLATPMAVLVGYLLLLPLSDGPSDQLLILDRLITEPTGVFAVVVLLSLTVVPGFVEEVFFRGYVQRRLLDRWPAVAAIGFTSLLFGAAHLDPQHFLLVLPLGVWLGVVTWRAGSVWPAVLCHFFTNLTGILSARLGLDPIDGRVSFNATNVAMRARVGVAFIVSIVVLVRYGKNRGQESGVRGQGKTLTPNAES